MTLSYRLTVGQLLRGQNHLRSTQRTGQLAREFSDSP